MNVYRIDAAGEIKEFRETREGFLDLHLTFSKVGPLQYQRADGIFETEYLTEQELFNEESLATATGKPVTFLHPPEGMVTKENVRHYTRGSTGSKILRNDPFAVIVATVQDAELIDVIKNGRARQVSAGYTTNVVKGDDGRLYQTSRCYNHLAVVPHGRAGELVRVHYDSGETDLNVGSNDVGALHTAALSRWKQPLSLSRDREILANQDSLPKHQQPLQLTKKSVGRVVDRIGGGPFDHLRKQG